MSVGVGPGDLAPGEAVVMSYEVGGELDGHSGSIDTGLTCIAQYIVGERGRDANGHPVTRDTLHETKLHEQDRELPAAVGQGQVQFTLPADAPPTSTDVVQWVAWAKIGSDEQRVPVAVRRPATAPAPTADATANGLTLHGVPDTARAGEAIAGTLTVELPEQLKAHNVSVRLIRRRTYVAEPATFEIQLPPDAGPDTAHQNGQVDWRLEAALHRTLHDDLTVAVPIKVF